MTNYTSFLLEEWITRIQNCQSSQMLADVLADLAKENNFEFFCLCLSLRRGLQQTELMLLTQTPSDWQDKYAENATIQNDPLFKRAQRQTSPITWHKYSQDKELLEAMSVWQETGLEQGIAFPLHGPHGFGGYLSMSRRQQTALNVRQSIHLMCLSQYILEQAFLIFSPEKTGFSCREKECLFWVSEGKTSWEIAQILGITERTVNFHLNNAIRKSGCKNRYQTVAKSIITGELAHAMNRVNVRHCVHQSLSFAV